MHFTSLFSVFAAVLAVNAATATDKSAVDAIVKDLESGDILGDLGDILTLNITNSNGNASTTTIFKTATRNWSQGTAAPPVLTLN